MPKDGQTRNLKFIFALRVKKAGLSVDTYFSCLLGASRCLNLCEETGSFCDKEPLLKLHVLMQSFHSCLEKKLGCIHLITNHNGITHLLFESPLITYTTFKFVLNKESTLCERSKSTKKRCWGRGFYKHAL